MHTHGHGFDVFLQPGQSAEALKVLASKKATAVSFDLLPRISRAQSMDALSSQATVSGYRAGLAAAENLARFFPMFMTAAGTVKAAREAGAVMPRKSRIRVASAVGSVTNDS